MSLIVEDGTGKSDAESYVGVADLGIYATKTGQATALTDKTEDEKEVLLRRATMFLDGKYCARFPGFRASGSQALEWPRINADYIDGTLIGESVVPPPVRNATCEAALKLIDTELLPDLDRGGMVASETVGPITTSYFQGAPGETIFLSIENAMRQLLGSNNVVRLLR